MLTHMARPLLNEVDPGTLEVFSFHSSLEAVSRLLLKLVPQFPAKTVGSG
jgi:hypothetical protein